MARKTAGNLQVDATSTVWPILKASNAQLPQQIESAGFWIVRPAPAREVSVPFLRGALALRPMPEIGSVIAMQIPISTLGMPALVERLSTRHRAKNDRL